MPVISKLLAKVAPNSVFSETFFPPPSTFIPARDMPDLSDKTAIVTGANTGIGYHIVRELLLKNAKVYLAARSPTKSSEAVERLKKDIGKEPLQLQLDLGDLHSVRQAAREIQTKEEKLDILFNNAGVMIAPLDQLTAQGYDLQFGINVLGHYYFTILLLPLLQRSAETNGVRPRIVNVSSAGHKWAPNVGIEWSVLKGGLERDAILRKWNSPDILRATWVLYGMSKMGNILVSNILNRHHGGTLASYSLHPGGIKSEIQRHGSSLLQVLARAISYPTPKGAVTPLWAGTMPEAEEAVGAYLIPWARIGRADPRGANEKLQDELRAYLEEQIKNLDH